MYFSILQGCQRSVESVKEVLYIFITPVVDVSEVVEIPEIDVSDVPEVLDVPDVFGVPELYPEMLYLCYVICYQLTKLYAIYVKLMSQWLMYSCIVF